MVVLKIFIEKKTVDHVRLCNTSKLGEAAVLLVWTENVSLVNLDRTY